MPWFGQVKEREGYIAICETPWNGGYYANHPANGPYTHVGFILNQVLAKWIIAELCVIHLHRTAIIILFVKFTEGM